MNATYCIPAENLGELTRKIGKLTRKAEKLGLPQITITIGATIEMPFERLTPDENGSRFQKLDPTRLDQIKYAEERGRLFFKNYVNIELIGETPRLAGWEFVATLQHMDVEGETVNLLKTSPFYEGGKLPEQFRTATPENCDHCQKQIRTRKETFVVRNIETSEFKQVGRNCTQDFLGGINPHSVAKGLEYLLLADMACSEAEEGEGWGSRDMGFGILDLLTNVACMVRVDGWVSRGRARTNEALSASCDSALSLMFPPEQPSRQYLDFKANHPITAEDKAQAEKALAYAREDLERDESNDYLFNLWVACNQRICTSKTAGLTASLIPHYIKEIERQTLKEVELRQLADSKYVGQPKDRVILDIQVMKVITLESAWGTSQLHKMIDADGNSIIWFSSNGSIPAGTKATIIATVKDHKEREGIKQTIVNRLEEIKPEFIADEKTRLEKKKVAAAKKAAKLAKLQGND